CNPLETILVDRFKPVVTSMANEIEIAIHVDDELIGTETLQLAEVPTSPVRLEILRFQPRVRQQLITRAGDGAVVDARSSSLTPEIVRLTRVQELSIAPDLPTAQIVRSTWRARSALEKASRSEPALRPIATGLTGLKRASAGSCFSDCEDERLLCEEQRCDFSPCAGCDAWYDDCAARCSCDGLDPVLVDEYTVESTIAVSGRLAVICAGDIFSLSKKTFYDVYDFVDRTETYRVWQDCHGHQTTELVSTVDSGVYRCHVYSGQLCSNSPGTPPFCVVG
ncbi:MAG TPA: hypothetical protein VF100_12005, partial [Thermoanaerobaculia bacterium]